MTDAGGEWLRINYDSGAATTAFPLKLAGDLELESKGEFLVASGQGITDFGRVKLDTCDEFYLPRRISGSVTEVHKPLGSAGELARTHDAMLWEDGGALIPKWSPIAKGLRREYARLLTW